MNRYKNHLLTVPNSSCRDSTEADACSNYETGGSFDTESNNKGKRLKRRMNGILVDDPSTYRNTPAIVSNQS